MSIEPIEKAQSESKSHPVAAFFSRLFIGGFVWALVSVLLIGFTLLSAVPYGGGSMGPAMMVLPWTVCVVFWICMPLFDLAFFKSGLMPVVLVGLIIATLASLYFWFQWEMSSGQRERKHQSEEFQSKSKPQNDYFANLCKSAGPRVFKTASNVDSVLFEGVRQKTNREDLIDNKFSGDVYTGFDVGSNPEASLVAAFLTKREWEQQWYVPSMDEFLKYPQVEVKATRDGITSIASYKDASQGSMFKADKESVNSAKSKYLVKIEDISTEEDRRYWIAGSRWRVIDIQTGEIYGESISYAMDLLQGQTVFSGSTGNAGEPWEPWRRAGHVQNRFHGATNACPTKDQYQKKINNLDFVRSVLIPIDQKMIVIPRPQR